MRLTSIDVCAVAASKLGMRRTTGTLASALVAISFLGLAAGALAAPRALAENYGLPIDDATGDAYVRALGMRDAILGLIILTFLARGERGPLATAIGLSALVGASDFTIVAAQRRLEAPLSLAIHGTGTLGLLAIYALLREAP
jgi:hypothetical protein